MKAMPLPFEEFQGKGMFDFSSAPESLFFSQQAHQEQQLQMWNTTIKGNCYVGSEPTSVLDTRRSPSSPTSSSTLSFSLGNGGGGGGSYTNTTTSTAGVAGAGSENPSRSNRDLVGKNWESVFSESSGQDQSILRMIMADVEDPSIGLNKLLQSRIGSSQDVESNAGFGVVDQGYGFEPNCGNLGSNILDPSMQVTTFSDFPFSSVHVESNNAGLGSVSISPNPNPIPMFSASASNLLPVSLAPMAFHQHQQHLGQTVYENNQLFNTQLAINKNQTQFTQNLALFMPLPYAQLQEHHLLSPSLEKRLNSGATRPYHVQKVPLLSPDQELFVRGQEQKFQLLPQHLQQKPIMDVTKQKMVSPAGGDDLGNQQVQQAIIDQFSKAAELIETGNPVLIQGILARLNQQLSPIGKPFQRAAFYFKEAFQLLLHMNTTTNSLALSPLSLMLNIEAYKSFSEISPVLQFANFTCNQAILEAMEGFNRIHVVDFDIGYGGQWASLMQELALRNGGGSASLKITTFASPSSYDKLELSFTRESLKHFAAEVNLAFELDILNLELLSSDSWPLPVRVSESDAIAVNLPIVSVSNTQLSLPVILRSVKRLTPKIVVSLSRGYDRADVPFSHHIIHALHSYSGLLESLDAVNVNLDALQKIERYLIQPGIEKLVLGRDRSLERAPPWKTLFMTSGFSPLTISNFSESLVQCLVQRTPVRGFHVEKRQSSLVLCWQQKELLSVSAWR